MTQAKTDCFSWSLDPEERVPFVCVQLLARSGLGDLGQACRGTPLLLFLLSLTFISLQPIRSPGGGEGPRKGNEYIWDFQASSCTKFIISSSKPEIKVGGNQGLQGRKPRIGRPITQPVFPSLQIKAYSWAKRITLKAKYG